jgi:hypothetical protein
MEGGSSTVTPNGQLRVARERSASTSSPGMFLSRQELAERVNAYVWDHYSKRREWDGSYLGKLEQGVIRWPTILCRKALREILGVSTDDARHSGVDEVTTLSQRITTTVLTT